MVFKAAIIGCGNIAGGYDIKVPDKWSFTHAGAYHLCPDTKLVAVADVAIGPLKRFGMKWGIERLYEDYREMLEKEAIDILSICLPTEKHYEVFEYAVKKDVPAIFCEKPLSNDLEEAKKMVNMSEGRVVSVNYFRRWNTTIVQLREELEKGTYGNAIHATVRYTKGVFVNGSHLIDLMRWFFGEPEEVNLLKIHNANEKDPGIDFNLIFPGGFSAHFLHTQRVEYVFIDIDVLMESGRVVIGQRGQKIKKYYKIIEPHYKKFNIIDNSTEIESQWKGCLTRAVQEIVECLRDGDNHTSCTPEDGMKALEIPEILLKRGNEYK